MSVNTERDTSKLTNVSHIESREVVTIELNYLFPA